MLGEVELDRGKEAVTRSVDVCSNIPLHQIGVVSVALGVPVGSERGEICMFR